MRPYKERDLIMAETKKSNEELLAQLKEELVKAQEDRKVLAENIAALKAEREAFEKEKTTAVDTTVKREKKRIRLDMSKTVTINIPQGRNDPDSMLVLAGGKSYQVALGEDVEVPYYVAQQIKNREVLIRQNRQKDKERRATFEALVNATA